MVRVLAAVVGLAVIVPAFAFGGSLAVEVIVGLVVLICIDEYARMAFAGPSRVVDQVALTVFCAGVYIPIVYLGDGAVLPGFLATALGIFVYTTLRPGPELKHAADRAGRMFLGTVWIGALMASFPLLRGLPDGLWWITLALALPWLGDTGAYFTGRAFGKHKLYVRISPKKTWEGALGGIIAATLGVLGLGWFALPQLGTVECVVLGLVLGGLAILGDLGESMLKRAFDVKDSGWIMPGHGGLLDRVDSVLFVAPALYVYVTVTGA